MVVLGGVKLASEQDVQTQTTWIPVTVTGGVAIFIGISLFIAAMRLRNEHNQADADNSIVITNGRADTSSLT